MEFFIVYDPATGKIYSHGYCPPDQVAIQAQPPHEVIVVEDGDTDFDLHYVVEGERAARPAFPVDFDKTEILADDTDVATMSGLPQPCVVKVDGEEYIVSDGVLEISSPMPATYVVEIDHWPYLPYRTEIVAHAPVGD